MRIKKGIKRELGLLLAFTLLVMVSPFATKTVDAASNIIGDRDWRWPVPSSRNISSCFPNYCGHGSIHHAIDISAEHGADIYASFEGTVLYTDNSCNDDRGKENGICGCGRGGNCLGKSVYILHSYKGNQFVSRYGHMASVNVSDGQAVNKNTVIGTVGSTGASTGNHLDFTIWVGNSLSKPVSEDGWVDPFLNQFLEKVSGLTHYGCNDSYVDDVNQLYADDPVPANEDIYPPLIQGTFVDNVTTESFRLNAKISDNIEVSQVIFETWKDGSPDRKEYVAGYMGDCLYSYDVKISDLTNEAGVYHAIVHAYDTRNESHSEIYIVVPDKNEDIYPPLIQEAYVDNVTAESFKLNAKISDNIGVNKVVFETWKDGSPNHVEYLAHYMGDCLYSCDVNISDLTNESGVYHSIVHAYDTRNESNSEIYIIVPERKEESKDESSEQKEETQITIGDVNGDEKINNKDVSYLARSLVGKETLSEKQKEAADVNGDGIVNNKDVAKLARYLVGKETKLDA